MTKIARDTGPWNKIDFNSRILCKKLPVKRGQILAHPSQERAVHLSSPKLSNNSPQ